MGRKWSPPTTEPTAGRPYAAVAFDNPDLYSDVRKDLAGLFGPVDYETPGLNAEGFISPYGGNSRKSVRFLSFKRRVGREELVDMRRKSLQLEARRQAAGLPLLEIDPGYISEYSVVRTALAEDFHRIYLYHGIYGEVLYVFERMKLRPIDGQTPAFFQRPDVLTIFNDMRVIYASEI